jgi:streptogramin lyase
LLAITTFPVSGATPWSIASGPDGNLWFTERDGNKIGMINPTTHAVTEFPIPTAGSQPIGIAAGADGNMWFTENAANKIGEINTTTHAITEFPTHYSGLWAITAGPDGNLWFGLGEINPITHVITAFSSTPGNVIGIAAGPDGNLWFTDFYGGGDRDDQPDHRRRHGVSPSLLRLQPRRDHGGARRQPLVHR